MAEYGHLSLVEREQIARLRATGVSLSALGRRLGRVASTTSRELRRNALPIGGDRPVYAEGCDRARRQRPAVPERDQRLRRLVHQRLLETWTPEQIAGWLKPHHGHHQQPGRSHRGGRSAPLTRNASISSGAPP